MVLSMQAHTRNETLAQLVNITAGANELTLLEEQYRQGKITSALCFRLLRHIGRPKSCPMRKKNSSRMLWCSWRRPRFTAAPHKRKQDSPPAPWNGFWPAGRRWRCSIIART